MKTDCFACRRVSANGFVCDALNKLECKKGNCPFYKTASKEEDELVKFNGVTSVNEACDNYALRDISNMSRPPQISQLMRDDVYRGIHRVTVC